MKFESIAFVNGYKIPNLGNVTSVSTKHLQYTFEIELLPDGMWLSVTALDGAKKGEQALIPVFNICGAQPAKVVIPGPTASHQKVSK